MLIGDRQGGSKGFQHQNGVALSDQGVVQIFAEKQPGASGKIVGRKAEVLGYLRVKAGIDGNLVAHHRCGAGALNHRIGRRRSGYRGRRGFGEGGGGSGNTARTRSGCGVVGCRSGGGRRDDRFTERRRTAHIADGVDRSVIRRTEDDRLIRRAAMRKSDHAVGIGAFRRLFYIGVKQVDGIILDRTTVIILNLCADLTVCDGQRHFCSELSGHVYLTIGGIVRPSLS